MFKNVNAVVASLSRGFEHPDVFCSNSPRLNVKHRWCRHPPPPGHSDSLIERFPAAPVPSACIPILWPKCYAALGKVKGFEENETTEMSALRLCRGRSKNPNPNPRPSRLSVPCSHCVGENDNSDGMAYNRFSQSTGQPLCELQAAAPEAPSSRSLCGSSANVRRLLLSGKNKLQHGCDSEGYDSIL